MAARGGTRAHLRTRVRRCFLVVVRLRLTLAAAACSSFLLLLLLLLLLLWCGHDHGHRTIPLFVFVCLVGQSHSDAVRATEQLKHELASEKDRSHKMRQNFARDLET